ncbi:MAG: zinc-ribbon domain-containing protein [Methanomassiliicoccales archaeon]
MNKQTLKPQPIRVAKGKTTILQIIGAIFCIVGSLMIISTAFLPWLEVYRSPGATEAIIVNDLLDFSDRYWIIFAIIAVSVALLLVALGEVALARREIKFNIGVWSLLSFLFAMVCIILITMTVLWITEDYSVGIIAGMKYGSAIFLAAFASVLIFSGSLLLLFNHLNLHRSVTAWSPARQEIRPRYNQISGAGVDRNLKKKKDELKCTNCGSPIEEGWIVCPICGFRLK